MSGKEIIDKAILQSSGVWRPSPGLIYPMLGRLLDEGLIDHMDDGRYKITLKGIEMIKDIESVQNVFQRQFEVLLRLGNVGRFMALDLIDRISKIGTAISSNADKMTEQERKRYKQFLSNELEKVNQREEKEEK